MTCGEVLEFADACPSRQLLTETNQDIRRHLDICRSCRTEIDGRRRMHDALRVAFDRVPELQPRSDFGAHLRERLRQSATPHQVAWASSGRWFALAASVLIVAGLTATVLNRPMFWNRSTAPADALAQDAIGDHQNCALKFRLVRTPVPLDEAAARFDPAFRLLLDAPPDNIVTSDGPAQVVERHSCAYGGRRFGHVVMQYRGRVVSLLMTGSHQDTETAAAAENIPQMIGRPTNGLSVVAVNGAGHAIVLVSDLGGAELTQLSKAVAIPLARRLEVGVAQPDRAPLQFVRLLQLRHPTRPQTFR
jgi:hypothetical protein